MEDLVSMDLQVV